MWSARWSRTSPVGKPCRCCWSVCSSPARRWSATSPPSSARGRTPINGRRSVHKGIDIAAPPRTPIHATAPGIVTFADWNGAYGRMVEIDHGAGFITRYGHLRSIDVKVGDRVAFHDQVGRMGSSGRSTGSHVHYEIEFQGSLSTRSNSRRQDAMFSKSKTPRAEAGRKTEPSPPSIISRGPEITGDMVTDGEVHIDGRVIGDIKCGKLVVGTGAAVRARCGAKHVDIRGQISGRIHGDVVTLASTARVVGDIWHSSSPWRRVPISRPSARRMARA